MVIIILKIAAYFHEFMHSVFNVNLPGMGRLFRMLKRDRVLKVKGKLLYMNHKCADNYSRLINGRFNEPETHIFIDSIISGSQLSQFQFVEIGANIGEFVLDYASNPKITKVVAFEPQPDQFFGLKETVLVNKFKNVRLINKPVSNKNEKVFFIFEKHNASSSGITDSLERGIPIQSTTLDEELSDLLTPTIMLIDVEGAEVKVMTGGINFIKKNKPIIIFEYNHVSKKYFTISDVQKTLGEDYQIYNLQKNGKLGKNFEQTWNLVAINKTGIFKSIIQ